MMRLTSCHVVSWHRDSVKHSTLKVHGETLVRCFRAPMAARTCCLQSPPATRMRDFRRRVWNPAVEATMGRPYPFHAFKTLEHSNADSGGGAHPKGRRLGHASRFEPMLDTYRHSDEGIDEALA